MPNCKDAKIKDDKPGPGTYSNVLPHKLKEEASTASETGDSSLLSGVSRQGANPFTFTTQGRGFWKNQIDTPYTRQTYHENPGPGHYAVTKKKGDDIKTRLLDAETVSVAFGQTAERDCNRKTKSLNPGPGTYIDINNPNNSSICKSLNKIKEDRTLAESQGVKVGIFGSTATRFNKGWNEPKLGPGPGQYDTNSLMTKPTMDQTIKAKPVTSQSNRVDTTLALEKKKPDSIFKSTTNRFDLCYSAKTPGIRILNKGGAPKTKIVA